MSVVWLLKVVVLKTPTYLDIHTYMMGDMRRRGDRRFAFDENKNLVSYDNKI